MSIRLVIAAFIVLVSTGLLAQAIPNPRGHAHNDYEHARPLHDALANGFVSVEADVHWKDGTLLVSHNRPGKDARTLEQLYLAPLDSVLAMQRKIHEGLAGPFFLMIDIKTDALPAYQAIRHALAKYPRLSFASTSSCPVKIFLSGNRPMEEVIRNYQGLALDGRPTDLGRGYSVEVMPVVSDHYRNWSRWNGKTAPRPSDLARVKELAQRVHAEGKMLRLWAIPDHPTAWKALMEAGVDLINTDHLEEFNAFVKTAK